MELWIRSQDRKDLISTRGICMTKGDYEQIGIFADGMVIGTYKTKERALEVLDEIHQRLIDLQTLEIIADCYKTINRDIDCVYQMPKK